MKFKKLKPKKRTHRLLVRVVVPNQEEVFTADGRQVLRTEWVEIDEINLGTAKKVKRDIIEFRLEPILNEEEDFRKDGFFQ